MNSLRPFRELGHELARMFVRYHHDPAAFPAIASDALERAKLPERVAPDALLRDAAAEVLPPQLDPTSTFGEPPITLVHHRAFVIDVYPWFSSTTSIHQHGFSGAFQVLHGGSVESCYAFRHERSFGPRLVTGALELVDARRLRQGDIRPILPDDGVIHALYHLEHPSFSIVVRTTHDASKGPQLQYTRAGVGFDPFFFPPGGRRRLEILAALLRFSPQSYPAALSAYLEQADMFEGLLALLGHRGRVEDVAGMRAEVNARFEARFGGDAAMLLAARDDLQRSQAVGALRTHVRDAEGRLVLALLLNVPSRARIEALLRAEGIDEPWRAVSQVLRRLASMGRLSVRLSDDQLTVIDGILAGLSDEELLQDLRTRFVDEDVEAARPKVLRFRPLLAREPLLRNFMEGP